ncbi:23S rRNA (uracil(1939)-C(5))-methyltransferase RlmD [Psychrosphaera ytuae]|uniref:23S rRNA (Uracil(1939)-C(5))-methyltransferase RlmD n=1 Tax=Psychrosphaera ytuae TaxID=2820710 RepID=A0A975HHY1_9GAMM|nr:23S rRNA (uracil(1939)-C(5))-methyltransferase RlmD [Psychrosphaera ytuae]QTH63597.1 23S rRNA (uracil(1939)-C(5))-methyltransferase RlmD [Psychrosphaera ytuae]
MARIFKPSKQLKSRKHASSSKQLGHFIGHVDKYDLQLKGIVSNPHNKVAFVPGVMVGEKVKVNAVSYTDKVIQGEIVDILKASEKRIKPQCGHFEKCGGCQLQYMSNEQQTLEKSFALQQLLAKACNLNQSQSEDIWQAPVESDAFGYRRAARLVTWWSDKPTGDERLQLGFREEKSKQVVDIKECPVLAPDLVDVALKLKATLLKVETATSVTHIQLFSLPNYTAVVVRITDPQSSRAKHKGKVVKTPLEGITPVTTHSIPTSLKEALVDFAEQQDIHLIAELDDQQFDVLRAHLSANQLQLQYQADQLKFDFTAKDFIQVNAEVNDKMIAQAMDWLNPSSEDTILDLFSGVGNFTLPLAKRAKHVIGVEGVFNMVKQLKHNAELNGLTSVEAYQADLSQFDEKRPPKWLKPIDKLLLDPARDGAFAVMQTIPKLKPKQILYISCNPTTMVRDIKLLISAGYQLKKAGILNMFPNTSHVEAMVLLEK